MTSNISAAQIIGDTLYLDLEGVIDDPVLRRMAECVRELRPDIDRNITRHGHGTTLAALVAIVANKAIDAGTGRLIAEAFRHNAEMLEDHEIFRAIVEGEPRDAPGPLQDSRSSQVYPCCGNESAVARPVLPSEQPGRGRAGGRTSRISPDRPIGRSYEARPDDRGSGAGAVP